MTERRDNTLSGRLDELATSMDKGFSEVRDHFAEMRDFTVFCFDNAVTGLRSDLRTEIAGLRTEFKTEISDVRTELKTEISDLRVELKAEMKSGLGRVERRLDRPEDLLGELPSEVRSLRSRPVARTRRRH